MRRKDLPKWYLKTTLRPSLRTLKDKKNLIGVEIGTDRGDNAINILETLDIEKLYLIDPYKFYDIKDGYVELGRGVNWNAEENKECEAEAHEMLKGYEDKIVWVSKPSEYAVSDIPNDLDFVYIDGNHRKEYVMKDIQLYANKLKPNGLLAGHDYDYVEVREAVHEILGECNSGMSLDSKGPDYVLDWWVYREV